jgi:hypothetical protein
MLNEKQSAEPFYLLDNLQGIGQIKKPPQPQNETEPSVNEELLQKFIRSHGMPV